MTQRSRGEGGQCTSAEGRAPAESTLNAPVEDPKASRTLQEGGGRMDGSRAPTGEARLAEEEDP